MTPSLLLDINDGLALLTLQRPERSNALSRQLLEELGQAGDTILKNPELRAVVITGAGDKAFCAGADLKERASMSDAEVREQLDAYRHKLSWLSAGVVPTVAAINGAALGGGLELALACDLRVARAGVTLGLPETSLGIIPGAGGTQRLPRLIGESRAKELILLGRRFSAEVAQSYGLVHHVVPFGDDFLEQTLEYLRPLREGAPIAQRSALRAINAALDVPLSLGLELEKASYEACLQSEDRKEALRAFAEKRPPKYRGR